MPKRIYVGNLPFSASDDEIRELFGQFGQVTVVTPLNRRGECSVELGDRAAIMAIQKLNGHEFQGKRLTVREE